MNIYCRTNIFHNSTHLTQTILYFVQWLFCCSIWFNLSLSNFILRNNCRDVCCIKIIIFLMPDTCNIAPYWVKLNLMLQQFSFRFLLYKFYISHIYHCTYLYFSSPLSFLGLSFSPSFLLDFFSLKLFCVYFELIFFNAFVSFFLILPLFLSLSFSFSN